MDIKLILALAKSGVSDAEIERLAGLMDGAPAAEPAQAAVRDLPRTQPVTPPQPADPAPAPHPAPATASHPAPATAPQPVPAMAPQAADPAGLESLLHEVMDSVRGLRDTVQASQVLTGYQGQPAQADQLRTATQNAAGFFYPPTDK